MSDTTNAATVERDKTFWADRERRYAEETAKLGAYDVDTLWTWLRDSGFDRWFAVEDDKEGWSITSWSPRDGQVEDGYVGPCLRDGLAQMIGPFIVVCREGAYGDELQRAITASYPNLTTPPPAGADEGA